MAVSYEPFSNWLEEKVELPILDNIRGCNYTIQTPLPQQHQLRFKIEDLKSLPQHQHHQQQFIPQQQQQQQHQQDTNVLLQEFETMFDVVDMTTGQLTPPQSPPLSAGKQIFTNLTPIYYNGQPGTPQPDVAHELAVVDELVRTCAETMVDDDDGDDDDDDEDDSNSTTSSSSSNGNSNSGFSTGDYSSDPEWIPDTVTNPNESSSPPPSSSSLVIKSARGRKRASKPYARIGPEDKKSRKKEQNKNAATRYRLKKKAESEEILSEEKVLLDESDSLQSKVTDLQREIKYLKSLMRELFKAKGLIE